MAALTVTAAIDLCDMAWGDRRGFVAISTRDTAKAKTEPGYWKDQMFAWPKDRDDIRRLLASARTSNKDVYWAPAVFDQRMRAATGVTTLSTLWADLDDADPKTFPDHLKPTAVWESSPGRHQAIWKLTKPIAAKLQQELNQRLTYALGADKGGWDLTQVLRIPGTHNHKYPNEPLVRLRYLNGHTLNPDKVIDDLPEVQAPELTEETLPKVVDTIALYQEYFNTRIKQLLRARHARVGDRSDRLWELECLLAERGLDPQEIATIVRETVWNKFRDRRDEVRRLLIEAQKAIDHAGPVADSQVVTALEPDEEVRPLGWDEFDREHKAIKWLVADIWGASEVGFISGLPKSYKSWVALDLAVSCATGTRFLNSFQSRRANTLLVQEEDPKPVLQDRLVKVAASKGLIEVDVDDDGIIEMTYDLPDNLHIISNQGFTLTEEWLDQLEGWIRDLGIELTILDPLMMIAGGGFDEFKAFEFMEKVLKPLKRLRARTQTAVALVHHHLKGSTAGGARDMYGSVALWAWEEAALHLQLSGTGRITAERFSKHSLLTPLTVEIGDVSDVWEPTVAMGVDQSGVVDYLASLGGTSTIDELASGMHLSKDAITRQLRSAERKKEVIKEGTRNIGAGRPRDVWRLV